MDIYHTQEQTENTHRSCKYLLLKTFFISYRSVLQYPILKVACVNKVRSSTTAILHLFSQETDILRKVIMRCVNIKLGYTGLFSLHIEPPSYILCMQVLLQFSLIPLKLNVFRPWSDDVYIVIPAFFFRKKGILFVPKSVRVRLSVRPSITFLVNAFPSKPLDRAISNIVPF